MDKRIRNLVIKQLNSVTALPKGTFSQAVLDKMEMDLIEHIFQDAQENVLRLIWHIPAEKSSVTIPTKSYVNYEIPKSWWQHFKQQYMPHWFCKRFPVQNDRKTIFLNIEVFAAFPKFPFAWQHEVIPFVEINGYPAHTERKKDEMSTVR